ncbi:MAG TPA: hypothetical protein ENI87_14570 [bacterium]|nr:hypothetical protein [bacterium]
MTRLCLLLLLPGILASACATGELPCESRRVVVRNPTGAAVRLHRVVRDVFGEPRKLGADRVIELRLATGRYALSVGDERPRFAVPLLPRELGYVPPTSLELTVQPTPPGPPGYCWIPPGPGLRGDDLGVGQEDERPVATPFVEGFWLATHETTNAQYVAFLNAIGRDAVDAHWLDLDGAKCRVQWDEHAQRFATDAPELPVVTVSWAGAVAYCDWLTHTTGTPHRLPTETEWEKAARGPGSRVYAYGDTCRTDLANQESGRLRAVGQYPPNGFGLFDMTANAFEWCLDAYARRAYADNPAADGPRAHRVLRGGSFVLDGIFCRNSMRMRLRPDVRADDVGFRVLREG